MSKKRSVADNVSDTGGRYPHIVKAYSVVLQILILSRAQNRLVINF